jgi:hypothetical protein
MAKFQPSRTAQYTLYKEIVINYDDFIQANTSGAVAGPQFGAGGVTLATGLPPTARVIGVDLIVETAFTGGGATAFTLDVGDTGLATRYAAAQSVFAAPANAVPLTVPNVQGALPVTVKGNLTGGTGLTAGRARIGIRYVQDKRSNEVEIL